MTPELQKYYEDQHELFSKKGWKDFMEHVSEIIEVAEDIQTIKDAEELHYRKGLLSNLKWLQGWEASVNVAYEQNLDT